MNLPDDFLRPPSYFLNKYESNHEFDKESEHQRQIIEDEMFAKALFEDSLFAADLHANPEWVLEEIKNNKNNKNNKKIKNRSFFRHNNNNNNNNNKIDPSDMNARKISFKQRFNTLGTSAKQKLGVLAQKLQRHKQQNKTKHNHQYKNVLTSLDDEALINNDNDDIYDDDDDDDNNNNNNDNNNNDIIQDANPSNRGTYQPPQKPSQNL